MKINLGANTVLAREGEYSIVDRPLHWQTRGLQQTASGYGAKLASTRGVVIGSRFYRIYVTQYSNAGTAYIVSKRRKYLVPDYGGDIIGWGPYVDASEIARVERTVAGAITAPDYVFDDEDK